MRRIRNIFLSTLFTTTFFVTSAQENTPALCANGVDDDGDGLVDCFDNECAQLPTCDDFFFGNSVVCFDEVDVESFALRQQWGSADETATSHASPAVGDLDQNGIPEVVTVNNFGDMIYVLDGSTGVTLFSSPVGFDPENTPAIANVFNDETSEILVTQNEGRRMALFEGDLSSTVWTAQASRNDMGIAGFADFNEDGIAEIYYKNEIVNAETGAIIVTGDGDWERDYVHGSLAIDVLPASDPDCIAAGGNCDGLELITGRHIWAIDIATGSRVIVKNMDDVLIAQGEAGTYFPKYWGGWLDGTRSMVSAADYNLDGNMDVLLSGALGASGTDRTTIFFWDVANQVVLTYTDPANNFIRGPGRINIGDVDGDGQPNANFVMNQRLYSLDENFNVHWVRGIKEGSSGFTGCTLFDFDGDGTIETVYRSEESVLIIDGTDGSTRREFVCVSRTQEEYPVVADVDGDGASEICVACYTNNATSFSPYSNTQFSQIRVYESDGEAWMPARDVWNQHAYFNVNINDDLTIPAELQDHTLVFSDGICEYSDGTIIPFPSRPLNNFLVQAPILDENGCVEFVSPDMVITGNAISATQAVCPEAEIDVTFTLTNEGDTDISGALPVSYYAGDPTQPGSIYLDTESEFLFNFEVNASLEITQRINGIGGEYELFVVVNDLGGTPPIAASYAELPNATIPECETSNNINSVDITFQPFSLTVEKLNDDRRCDLTLTPNGSARAYYFGPTPGDVESIYFENFDDLSNGTTSDAGTSAWTSDPGTFGPNFFGVADFNGSKMFRANRTGTRDGVGEVTWTSQAIDISDHTDVSVTLDIFENGNQEGSSSVWVDYVIMTYQIFDNGNNLITSGQFPTNGSIDDDFTYAQASLTGLRPNETDADSLLVITATIHNTSGSENHYLDNVLVQGTGPDVIKEHDEADGFEFRWYNQGNYTTVLHTGSTYAQIAPGTYDVISTFPGTGCVSDTVSITIQNLNATSTPPYLVNAWIYEVSPLQDCDIPDGALQAFVYTQTQNGTFPASVANPPLDTLGVIDGYSFTWRITNDPTNTPIATGELIQNLSNQSYTVDVLEDFSGCTTSAAETVSSGLSFPPDPNITVVNITTCGGFGTLSADVNGNTTDYIFEWFDGSGVKPVADFTGVTYTVNDIGDYTVRATQISSSCPSNPVTDTMVDDSSAPVATLNLVQDNTSCVSGNGIISADGDGAGTVTGFTFDWFKGANTLPANALPGAAEPNSFLVSDNPFELGGLTEGTYRVVVTEDATTCSDTLDIFVTDVPGTFVVTPADLVVIDINSCNPSVFGSIDASGVVPGDVNNSSIGNINVSFEDFDIRTATNFVQDFGGSIRTFLQDDVPGWSTTAPDNRIEIWHNDNTQNGGIHDAFHGEQFAEINANSDAALYFDLSTTPGSLLNWSFAHKGRAGTDELSVNIGAPGAEVVQGNFSTGNLAWSFYTGNYTIPTGQFTTRFQFEAVSTAAGNNTVGNFVDTISFVLFPYRFELFQGLTASGTPISINTDGQFDMLDDGDYVLVVYDNLTGCNATEIPFTLERNIDEPQVVATPTPDMSCLTGNGLIDVTASMPVTSSEPSAYTYQLFNGHSFASQNGSDVSILDGSVAYQFTDLEKGDYRVNIINNDSECEDFVDVVVGDMEVTPVVISTFFTDNSDCGAGNGAAGVNVDADLDMVQDNPNLFRFTWYDGPDTSSPLLLDSLGNTPAYPVDALNLINKNTGFKLDAGAYTVVIESIASGCESAQRTIALSDDPYIPNIIVEEVSPQTDCGPGNGSLRAYVTNDPDGLTCPGGCELVEADGFTFQWSQGGVPIPGGNTSTIANLTAGTYEVDVTYTLLSCTGTESAILSLDQTFPILSLNTSQPNTTCDAASYTGSITVQVEFGIENPVADLTGYTFTWYNGSGASRVLNASSTTETLSGLNEGDYSVEVQAPNSCTSNTLVLSISDVLPVVAGGAGAPVDNSVCAPDGAGGNPDYNGSIAFTPTTDGVPAAAYTFALRTSGGTNILPAGATGGIYADVDFTANGVNSTVIGLPAGNYIMAVSDDANTCDVEVAFVIGDDFSDVPVIGVVATSPNTTCDPTAYNGTADATGIVSGGSGTYTYFWATAADPGTQIDDDAILDDDISGNTGVVEGDYILIVTDAVRGCVSLTENVTIAPNLPVVAGGAGAPVDNSVCAPDGAGGNPDYNGSIAFTPTTDGVPAAAYTFALRTSGGTNILPAGATGGIYADVDFTANGVNSTVIGLPAGNYIMAVSDDANTCDVEVAFVIGDDFSDVPVIGVVATSPNTTCDPTAYNGTADATGIVSGGSGTYTYFWATAADPGTQIDDDAILDDDISGNTGVVEGDYILIVTDAVRGCVSLTENVTIAPNLPVVAGGAGAPVDNSVCAPDGAGGNPDYNGSIAFTPTTDGVPAAAYTFALRTSGGTNILPAGATGGIYADVDFTANGVNSTVIGLPAGNYIMAVSDDANTCDVEVAFVIGDDFSDVPVIGVVATSPNTTCDPTAYNGTADATGIVSGGSGTYTYFWATAADPGTQIDDDAILDDDISGNTGVVEGDYILIVTDAVRGCVSLTENVTIAPNLPVVAGGAGAPVDNSVCAPDGAGGNPDYNGSIAFTPTTDGVPAAAYTFALRTSGGTNILPAGATGGIYADVDFNANGVNSTVIGLPAGNYIMAVSDDANTCDVEVAFVIGDDFSDVPVIGVVATSPNTTCDPTAYNGTADATGIVSGGSGTYTYFWATAADPGTQIDDDAILDDDISGNTGVVEGDYILIVTDAVRGCVSLTENVTIGVNLPVFTINTSVLSIDYSCNPLTPTGSITAGVAGGSTGYTLEWYAGTSAIGTVLNSTTDADNTISNRAPGNYTVKVIDNSTTCFETETIEIIEDSPNIGAIVVKDQDQSTCFPADGQATVTPSFTFPGGVSTGFTASYSFAWYDGPAASPGALLAGQTTTVLSNVTAGVYTVVVTETSSGCQSAAANVTILDITPAPPTITIVSDATPGSCNAQGGEISATIAGGSGPFNFFWYEGSDDFANNDPTGANALADGVGQLVADPTANIDVNNTSGTTTELDNIVGGLYTLVVEDASGCRHQSTFDLPFNGIQTTTTLTVTDVSECPDNGVASVSLADNQVITVAGQVGTFETLEPYTTTGGAAGVISIDQGGTIQLSVTAGALAIADVISGTTSGASATITGVSSVGFFNDEPDDIEEYIIYLYSGSGVPADRFTPYDVVNSVGTTLRFPYTFNPTVGDVLDGDGVIIASPGVVGTGGTVTFSDLPEGPYTAIAREKVLAPFGSGAECWSTSATEVLDQEAFKPIISNATITEDSFCNAGTGNGEIAVTATKDVGDIVQLNDFQFELFDNTMAPLANPGNVSNATSTTFTGLNAGTYFVTVTRLGLGGPATNGCDTTATYVVPENQEVHEITSAGITTNDDCNPLNGAAIITDADITDNVADYTFTWYFDVAGLNVLDVADVPTVTFPAGANGTTGANEIGTVPAGPYYVQGVHDTKGCQTPLFEVIVPEGRVIPAFNVAATALDVSCDDVNPTGQATVTITNGSANPADYTFSWFENDGVTPLAIGTFTVNNSVVSDLPDDTYFVQIEDDTNPGDGCVSTLQSVTIDQFNTSISVVNFTLTPADDCNPLNGGYAITDITETRPGGGAVSVGAGDFALTDYRFNWFENDQVTPLADALVVGFNNGDLGANEVAGLAPDTYYVQITNANGTGCAQPTSEFVEFTIDDDRVNPTFNVVATALDVSCDDVNPTGQATVTITNGSANPADYTFSWFENDGVTPLAIGTFTVNNSVVSDLPDDTYFVQIEDDTNPGDGCVSTLQSVTIDQFNTSISVVNFTLTPADDCNPLNGGYAITDITETRPGGGAVSVGAGDFALTDYRFNWFENDQVTPLADALVVGFNNGDLGANEVAGLAPDTYYVQITNANGTGCAQPTSEFVEFTIDDDRVNPTFNVVATALDVSCDDVNPTGQATVTITNGSANPADYTFSWFENDGVTPLAIGTFTVNNSVVSDLPDDTYFVQIEDDTNPGDGCVSTLQSVTIDQFNTSISVVNFTLTPADDCNPLNGGYAITDITETRPGGGAVSVGAGDFALTDYRFNWFENDQVTPLADALVVGFNNGDLGANEVAGLAPDTYYVQITNANGTGCAQPTSEFVEFTIDDDRVNPTFNVVATALDVSCDDVNPTGQATVTITNGSANPADYTFSWFENDGVTPLAIGTFTVNNSVVSDLPDDTYFVQIEDDTNPGDGCVSTLQSVTIDQFNTSISVVNFTLTPADDCNPLNGGYAITDITETRPGGGAVSVGAGDFALTDYRFNWFENDQVTPLADALVVGFNNGDLGANEVAGLAPDTYYVQITNANGTGCAQPTSEFVEFTIDDDTGVIVVSEDVANSSADTFCDNAGNAGDGILEIDITEDGAAAVATDFTITWYRGNSTAGADEIFPADGGTRGTATDLSGDLSRLGGLATGDYTITIVDASSPNLGCTETFVLNVGSMDNIPVLLDTDIQARAIPDTLCGVNSSGRIILLDSDISDATGPTVLSGYFIEARQGSSSGPVIYGAIGTSPQTDITNGLNGLDAADYFVTARDLVTGCTTAAAVINVEDSVRNPQIGIVSITPDQNCGGATLYGGAEVIIDNVFDHTAARFDVQWHTGFGGSSPIGGANAVTISNVAAGNYSVVVDNNLTGCASTIDVVIPNEPIFPSILVSDVQNNEICNDNGTTVPPSDGSYEITQVTYDGVAVDPSTVPGEYTLVIYPDPSLTGGTEIVDNDGATPFLYEELAAGDYYAVLTHVPSGCESNASRFDVEDILTRPVITTVLVASDVTCDPILGTPNGSLTATADGGLTDADADLTFQWYVGSGTGTPLAEGVPIANGSTPVGVTTSTISGLAADTYTVEVTRISTGCTSTDEFVLPNTPQPVEITAVDVTNSTSCFGNGAAEITTVSFGVPADYTYDYFDTDPTVGSPLPIIDDGNETALVNQMAGTYYVIGTHSTLNCVTPVFQIDILENISDPDIQLDSFDFQTNCDPSNPNGSFTITSDVPLPDPDYTVIWYFGTDTSNPLDDADIGGNGTLSGETTANVEGLPDGFYTVEVTNLITGCSSTETFQMADDINNPIALSTSTSANTSCIAPDGIMAVSVIQPAPGRTLTDYNYYWYRGDLTFSDPLGSSPLTPSPAPDFTGTLITGVEEGVYTVFVVDLIDNFCRSVGTVVEVPGGFQPTPFDFAKTDVTVCFDVKDGSAEVTLTRDVSEATIAWFDDTNQVIGTDFRIANLDLGSYRLELTDVTTGCVTDTTFFIDNMAEIPPAPLVIVNANRTNCSEPNGTGIANVEGIQSGFLFEWFNVNDMTTPYAVGAEVANLDSASYLVRATNMATGCESPFAPVDVRYEITDPAFEVQFEIAACLRTEDGAVNQFNGTAIVGFDEFNAVQSYRWENENGEIVGTDSRLIDIGPGTYTVYFVADNGCEYSETFTMSTDITVYNGLSPNDDGLNDFLLIDCIDYFAGNKVEIFNRDGVKVYEEDDYDNVTRRFEGFSNVGGGGLQLPSGTYFAVVELNDGREPMQFYLELVR